MTKSKMKKNGFSKSVFPNGKINIMIPRRKEKKDLQVDTPNVSKPTQGIDPAPSSQAKEIVSKYLLLDHRP